MELRPELAEAHANLGSIYYQIRDDEKAAASLQRAIDLNPQLAAPQFFRGVVAIRQQDHSTAVRHLEASVRLDPSNAMAPLYLGEAYFGMGRHEAAATAFWKATRHQGFRADAYYSLNRACTEVAESILDRLAAEYPGSFFVHLALGQFHEGRRNWKEAGDEYHEALKRNPDAAGLESRLSWIRRNDSGGQSGAPPSLPEARPTLLGMLYDPPAASDIVRLLESYSNLLGTPGRVQQGPESLFERAGDYQVVAYLAARWIDQNDPGSYRARQLRAQLLEAQGETDGAVSEYRAALQLKPGLRDVHFAIGTLLWSLSRFDEAPS